MYSVLWKINEIWEYANISIKTNNGLKIKTTIQSDDGFYSFTIFNIYLFI